MILCININIKVFYKETVPFLLVIARYAQSTQNSKFVILLQHLKKEGRDEVDFLHGYKHQSFLQVDLINLGGHGQPSMSKLAKITSLQNLCDISRKKLEMKLNFCGDEH